MKTDLSTIQGLFVEKGLELTEEQYNALCTYGEFLVEYNKNVNLTAITDPVEIWNKHFLDSIYPLSLFELPLNASVIDVGTGAGFPGVPMNIYRKDLKLTMLDSLQKRLVFLEQLAEKTKLTDWKCVHGRAEDAGHSEHMRESYDVATARAVAALPVLCEYCLPFVKVGGVFIALKGPGEDGESAKSAIEALGGQLEKEFSYNIYGEERRLIVVRKISHTPTCYPRKSKKIQQKPL